MKTIIAVIKLKPTHPWTDEHYREGRDALSDVASYVESLDSQACLGRHFQDVTVYASLEDLKADVAEGNIEDVP